MARTPITEGGRKQLVAEAKRLRAESGLPEIPEPTRSEILDAMAERLERIARSLRADAEHARNFGGPDAHRMRIVCHDLANVLQVLRGEGD